MSDIVETLRKGEDEGVDGWWSVMAEGANEIERLRAENEKLRRDVKTAVMGDSAELQDVKRENEKLRELVKAAYYEAYRDRDSLGDAGTDDPEDRCAWRLSDAAAAIRESGE